jgi:hypothetical protein
MFVVCCNARLHAQLWNPDTPLNGRVYTFRYYQNGKIVSFNVVRADDDDQAIELAKEAQFGFDLEVWADGRFVFGSNDRRQQEVEHP